MLPLLVPLLSIATTLGPEVPLGAVRIGNAPYAQVVSSVASDGNDFLALWSDDRNKLDPNIGRQFKALYAGRIDTFGRPLNPVGHKLFDAALGKMVWSGHSYLLVYTLADGHSFVQQLDDDGNLTGDARALAISGIPVAIASNRQNVLIINSETYNGVSVTLLGIDGAIVSTTSIEMDRLPSQPFLLPGGDYGFVGIHSNGCGGTACAHTVSLFTISAVDGRVTDRPLFDVSIYANVAGAASEDGRILIAVEQDTQQPASRAAAYTIIRPDGGIVVPMTTLETEIPRSISGIENPAVGWDGHEFLITAQWPSADERSMTLQGFRITSDGAQLNSQPSVLDETVYGYNDPPQFASSAATHLMAWNKFTASDTDVFVRAASSFDEIAAAVPSDLTMAPQLQRVPKLAAGPFAVWAEDDHDLSLHASTIGGVDSSVIGSNTKVLASPAVARGLSSYLVVWRLDTPFRIVGRRMTLSGTPLGDVFVIATEDNLQYASADLSVAFNGRSSFLVTWISKNEEVHAARVSESGSVLDSTPLIPSNAFASYEQAGTPRAVATSSGFLLVWIQDLPCYCLLSPQPPPRSKLYVAQINDDGALEQPREIWSRTGTDNLVVVPMDNQRLSVIWRDPDFLPYEQCITRLVLREDGSPASGIAPLVCTAASFYSSPLDGIDATWDRTALVLVWRDTATEAVFAQPFEPNAPTAISPPLQVNPAGAGAIAPSVSANGSGVTIAYQRLADVSRVFARTLERVAVPPRRRAAGH